METIDVDRSLIRRSMYGLRKLRGEFPAALERYVEDAAAWAAGVEAVLAALQPVAHDRGSPPAGLAGRGLFSRSLERDIAALPEIAREAADRLTWVYATRPKALAAAVRWLAEECPALPSAVVSVQLAHLVVAQGPRRAAPLVRLLSDERADSVALHGGAPRVQQATAALDKDSSPASFARPRARLGAELRALLERLLREDSATQRRTLALLGDCDLAPLLTEWVAWWCAVERDVERARGIYLSSDARVRRAERLEPVRRRLLARQSAVPPVVDAGVLMAALQRVAGDDRSSRAARRLAAVAPAGLGARCAWIHHVGVLARVEVGRCPERLPRVAAALARYLTAVAGNDAALAPWRTIPQQELGRGQTWSSLFEDDLFEVGFPASRIDAAFEMLTRLAEERADQSFGDLAARVGQIAEVLGDPARALELARALHATDRHRTWLSPATIVGIDLVAAPGSFAEVIEPLLRLHMETSEMALASLTGALLRAVRGDRTALRALLVGADLGLVLSAGRRLAIAHKLRALPAEPDGMDVVAEVDLGWIGSYPAGLHEALTELARSGPDARAIADRLLVNVVRSPAAIAREQAAIAERLERADLGAVERARLCRRARNLEQWRRAPVEPSTAKLAKLSDKIRRRAAAELLRGAVAAGDRALLEALRVRLGVEPVPEWLLEDRCLRVLAAALDQPANLELALVLLRRRCGPPPWDLREVRANADFIARCRDLGIDMSPWLDGIGERRSGTMTLRLEGDPLEIFYMGEHFETCLGLGQCNFFSVFANAADINKRVLYARDEHGTVVGRRLLCITDAGALVAFRAYAHIHDGGFSVASDAFACELAEAMGTTTAARGPVSTLVARRWYDDGSVDVTHRFDFLTEGSPFRQSLAAMPPEELPAAIEHHTGRREVDAILAPMLAALPEICARPPLAISLTGLLLDPRGLPGDVAIRMATAVERAGAAELAASLFADGIERYIEAFCRAHGWLPDAIDFLARVRPSRTLRILRRTRLRGVRRWSDERDAPRLLAGARCLLQLRRRNQARALLERVLSQGGAHHERAAAKQLLTELGAS